MNPFMRRTIKFLHNNLRFSFFFSLWRLQYCIESMIFDLLPYKKGNKSERNLKRQLWVLLLVYDRNINQKLLSKSKWCEKWSDLLVHWIENKKDEPFYCNFITHPDSVCFTYPIIQVRWFSMFVWCIYTLACCPLGGVTQIVRLHILFFWHFRCLLSRKDNKDKWQQNTKSPRQTAFIHTTKVFYRRNGKRKENMKMYRGW